MVDPSQAFVLSGGGVFGAYQVGVMKALMEGRSAATGHRQLVPGVLSGTSTGGYNATFLTAQCPKAGPEAIRQLESVWLGRIGGRSSGEANGVYRFRANPFIFLRPEEVSEAPLFFALRFAGDLVVVSRDYLQRLRYFLGPSESFPEERLLGFIDIMPLISTQPLKQTIRATIDFEAVQASPIDLRILVTNWTTGGVTTFDNRVMYQDTGPGILQASTAVPGMFPWIQAGVFKYVDGGLLANLPVASAIRAGATSLHAIYPNRWTWSASVQQEPGLVAALLRNQGITWANAARRDIQRAQAINGLIDRLRRLQSRAKTTPHRDPDLQSQLHELEEALKQTLGNTSGQRLPLVEIHNYCLGPIQDKNPLGPMAFSKTRVQHLMERGFFDAVHHDCKAARCILPQTEVAETTAAGGPP